MSLTALRVFEIVAGSTPRYNDEEEDEDSNESSGDWIKWFCRLIGHEIFVEVDEEYIRDPFNLYGLKSKIKNYDKALNIVLGLEQPEESYSETHIDEDSLNEVEDFYRDATNLFGLIHARYIITPAGLMQTKKKFLAGQYGFCPRVLCKKQRLLPTGLSDALRTHRVRFYCPLCQECYECKAADVDGAFFGTSFSGIFLQTFSDLVPLSIPVAFVPKIFGFKIQNKKSIIQYKIEQEEYGSQVWTHQISKHPTAPCDSTAKNGQGVTKPKDHAHCRGCIVLESQDHSL